MKYMLVCVCMVLAQVAIGESERTEGGASRVGPPTPLFETTDAKEIAQFFYDEGPGAEHRKNLADPQCANFDHFSKPLTRAFFLGGRIASLTVKSQDMEKTSEAGTRRYTNYLITLEWSRYQGADINQIDNFTVTCRSEKSQELK